MAAGIVCVLINEAMPGYAPMHPRETAFDALRRCGHRGAAFVEDGKKKALPRGWGSALVASGGWDARGKFVRLREEPHLPQQCEGWAGRSQLKLRI